MKIVRAIRGFLTLGVFALSLSAHAMEQHFDFESARLVSNAVSTGHFDEAIFANYCTSPDGAAIIRKLRLKDCDALLAHFKSFEKSKKAVAAAQALTVELSKPGYGKYAPLAEEVTRQLAEYVPAEFQANLHVHFIFGSYSGGFAFDDVPDDVYVNLVNFADATTQELAETVAHELFHAVQGHLMRLEPLPKAAGPAAVTGPIWMNYLLVNLEQEGTAELFTHPVADRPATPYSEKRKLGIQRNASRINSLIAMFETLGWRMLYVPPKDENAYDRIYGLMFYTDFDETAYDLGWLMASTIVKTDGKMAIYHLLKQDPKQFVLRYQAIALADGKLPTFSSEFIKRIETL